MEKIKLKKIPVVTYLCYLLIVSLLFTAVTFSRYTGSYSGEIAAPLGRFVYSYTIDNISSTAFSNVDYWLTTENKDPVALNALRMVRFSVANYVNGQDGTTDRISDVDLQSTIRLKAPAEFLGNLAIQVAEVSDNESLVPITPQYVLGNLIYQVKVNEDTGKYAYTDKDKRQFASGTRTIETSKFIDYNARPGAPSQTLTVTGGFDPKHVGTIHAAPDAGGGYLSITSALQNDSYSVGFRREDGNMHAAPLLYLDLEKETPFYTVDIALPQMILQGNKKSAKQFVVYFTVVEKTSNDDFNAKWEDEYNQYLTENPSEELKFNGATVTGYHFNRNVKVYTGNGRLTDSGATTTLLIRKAFNYEDGTVATQYFHLAPVADGSGDTFTPAHRLTDFADAQGATVKPDLSSNAAAAVQELFANHGEGDYLCLSGVTDFPQYLDYAEQKIGQTTGGKSTYIMKEALAKRYTAQLNMVFVQASE